MRRLLISAVTTTVAALLLAPAVFAAPDDVNTQRLRNGVTTSGILNHMRALQRAANANDGNRAANTTGYEASLDYVERRMNGAGYETERVPFDFAEWTQNAPATLQVGTTVYAEGTDYIVAEFSGSGNVTGPIVPIDYTGPPPEAGASTSGCEATDFPANPAPNSIALVQRGTCVFVDKIRLAEEAGYAAVLIANDGFRRPDRADRDRRGAVHADSGGDDELDRRACAARRGGPDRDVRGRRDHDGVGSAQPDRRHPDG